MQKLSLSMESLSVWDSRTERPFLHAARAPARFAELRGIALIRQSGRFLKITTKGLRTSAARPDQQILDRKFHCSGELKNSPDGKILFAVFD